MEDQYSEQYFLFSILDVLGTPAYFAPETLKCVVYDNATGYGKPVDL